uniref:Cadherin domain-containing protein n=1 Tax=Knipowitschia caucasica TaxID=637954 RepID=A0AAV2J0E7_KNICA
MSPDWSPPSHPYTLIGSIISQVTGNDVDSGPALSYSLQLEPEAQGLFSIQRYGGALSLTGALDFESRSCYTLIIRSSDSRHQNEANLTLMVQDVNDNRPQFTQHLYQVRQHLYQVR